MQIAARLPGTTASASPYQATRHATHRAVSSISLVAGSGRSSRDWRVQFKEDDKDQAAADSVTDKARQDQVKKEARERLKKGTPGSLQDLSQVVEAAKEVNKFEQGAPVLVNPFLPAFTRRREIFVGRMAMVGFFMACFWEIKVPFHPGILQQVSLLTGLEPATVATGLLVLITYNVAGALAPWSPTWSLRNLLDVSLRPTGPPAVLVNPFKHPLQCLGLTTGAWGFTKANELFHGRLAMLGFLGALIQEIRLGGVGPLAQVAYYLGIPADDHYYSVVSQGFVLFSVLVTLVAYTGGRTGTTEGEEEIY